MLIVIRSFYFSFEGDAIRRFEPVPNINNTNGYKRLSMGLDESDIEGNQKGGRSGDGTHDDSFTDAAYYTDVGPESAGPVEQLFKSLLEYAGVELSVSSSIEPLFEKLGQTVLASVQIKRFDVKILPNEPTNESQLFMNTSHSTSQSVSHPTSTVQYRLSTNRPSILNTSNHLSILSVTNLSIQSVCRQSLEHDQLHSANVQAGIRVQRVQQEVNLSFIRLVYQFYTVVGNALEYTGIDELTKAETDIHEQNQSIDARHATMARVNSQGDCSPSGIESLVLRSLKSNLLRQTSPFDDDDLTHPERQCWKKLRQLVAIYGTLPEVKQVQPPTTTTRKQQRSGSQPPNDNLPSSNMNSSMKYVQTQTRIMPGNTLSAETLLLSSFGWLIIDEIYYAASLGGLKVDGCMGKVQGSVTLSQRLRPIQSINHHHHHTKK
jgi:hypothetical protein